MLKCSDGTYYTGVTNDLDLRVIQHNLGIKKESYTYSRRPVTLVWHEIFNDYNLAFDWETRIKKWSVKKKEALIQGDFELIKKLSKKDFSKRKK